MFNLFGDKYKKIMDNYFRRQEEAHINSYGHKPRMPFDERVDKTLYVSTPNKDGWAEWKPIPAEMVDWNSVESELGFKVHNELKKYYTTYKFLELSGSYKGYCYNFMDFGLLGSIERNIIGAHLEATYYKNDKQYFLLGITSDDYTDYDLYYDNENNILFFYDSDFDKVHNINLSIFELINKMEGR